jgi:hypothetical protein
MSREPEYSPLFTERDERIACVFAPIIMRKAIEFGLRESMLRMTSIFFRHSGKAMALNYRSRYGLTGSSAKDVALPLYWGHSATSAGAIEDLDVHEKGAIGIVNHCPFGWMAEICQSVSYSMAEGICSETNPEWRYTFSRSKINGEASCRYLAAPKGTSESDIGRSVERIRISEMSAEERAELGRHCCCVITGGIAKAAIDASGSKAEAIMKESGREAAEVVKDIIEADGHSIVEKTPVEIFCAFASAFGWMTTASDEGAIIVNDCPFLDGPDEFCKAIETMISLTVSRSGRGSFVKCLCRKMEGGKECRYLIGGT